MRQDFLAVAVTLLAVTSALSGCFGKDDGGDGTTPTDPTPTSPTGTTPTGGTGTTPTNPTGGTPTTPTGGTPTPPKPADVNTTVSLTGGPGLPVQPATATATATVPSAGWAAFTVTCTPTDVKSSGVDVVITDSTTAEVGRMTFSAPVPPPQPGQTGPPQTAEIPATAAPGDFTFTASTTAGSFTIDCNVLVTY